MSGDNGPLAVGDNGPFSTAATRYEMWKVIILIGWPRMKLQEPQERLTDRIAWRINEWCELTSTSRPTAWRQAKSGKLKLAYVDKTPYVTRAEAIRLGFIES